MCPVADKVVILETSGGIRCKCRDKTMSWEYSVELISFVDIAVAAKALNKWGQAGWDVAAIIPKVGGVEENWTVVVLKRPIEKSK